MRLGILIVWKPRLFDVSLYTGIRGFRKINVVYLEDNFVPTGVRIIIIIWPLYQHGYIFPHILWSMHFMHSDYSHELWNNKCGQAVAWIFSLDRVVSKCFWYSNNGVRYLSFRFIVGSEFYLLYAYANDTAGRIQQ